MLLAALAVAPALASAGSGLPVMGYSNWSDPIHPTAPPGP